MVGVLPVREILNVCSGKMEGEPLKDRDDQVCVGSRIKCDDSIGTVRYIGEVVGHQGMWYGIDWDCESRGRHDGSVSGVRYFNASSETSGSFVRPHKLHKAITCAEAIQKYYGEKEDETTAALHKAVIEDWKRQIKVPFIEMIGFESVQEKQGSLERLQEACVGDRCVRSGGSLAALCPALHVLDISRSLLPSWRRVADLAVQLPLLESLDLSKNRLVLPQSDFEADAVSPCFPNLKKILLTSCAMDWPAVQRAWRMFPQIQELVLANNLITDVQVPVQLPPAAGSFMGNVTSILLDGNMLERWKNLEALGGLEKLKVLSLNGCGLNDVRIDETFAGEKSETFKSLEVLHLKYNNIKDWRSISELDKIQKLNKLYFIKNPLMEEEDYDTCCQLIIGRMGSLKELNGSEIASDSRRGAEYDYLKKHGKTWKMLLLSETKDLEAFLLEHSRFQYLIQKHGMPDDSLLEVKENTSLICTRLISLTIVDTLSGAAFPKRLPSSMSVQKLLALVRRLLPGRSRAPLLYCLHAGATLMTIPLDNRLKGLDYYSLKDGDTVLVKWQ